MAKFNVYVKGGFFPMGVDANSKTQAGRKIKKLGYTVREVTVCTDNTELFNQMRAQGLSPLD